MMLSQGRVTVAAQAAFGSLTAARRTSSRPSRQLERRTRFSARSAGEGRGVEVVAGVAAGVDATGGALVGSTVTVGDGIVGGGGGAGTASAPSARPAEQRTSASTTMILVITAMIQGLPRSPPFVVPSRP